MMDSDLDADSSDSNDTLSSPDEERSQESSSDDMDKYFDPARKVRHTSPEESLISIACRHGDVNGLRSLIESGESLNVCDKSDWYPTHEAAFAGNTECLRLVLEQETLDVNLRTAYYDRYTALHYAAMKGHVECVRLLLSHNADPEVQSGDLSTPLLSAISKKNTECALLLISKSKNIDTQDYMDIPPVCLAAQLDLTEVLQVLLDRGCDLKHETAWRQNAIGTAAQYGSHNCLKLMVSDAIKRDLSLIDQPSRDGETPLFVAAGEGHLKCVSLLLKNGADPTRQCKYGKRTRCALTAAVISGYKKCTSVLWKSRPQSLWNKCQPDLLNYAICTNQGVSIIKTVLELGCGINHPRIVNKDHSEHLFSTYLDPDIVYMWLDFSYEKITPVTQATIRSERKAMVVLKYKPRIEPKLNECPTLLVAIVKKREEVVDLLLGTFKAHLDYHYPDWLTGNLSVILSLSQPEILLKLLKSGAEVDSMFAQINCGPLEQISIGSLFKSMNFDKTARKDCLDAGTPWSKSAVIRLMLEFTGNVKLDPSLQSTISPRDMDLLTKVTDNVYSLEHLCRRKVRQCLGSKKLRSKEFVDQLELPVNVLSYLMYEDVTYEGITQIMSGDKRD